MAKYPRTTPQSQRKSPPATTPEGRENQLVSLAFEVAEERLRNRTASAQEIVQLMKMGSVDATIERDILKKQKELITAKTEAIRAQRRVEELYAEAIVAMKSYAGHMNDHDRVDDED